MFQLISKITRFNYYGTPQRALRSNFLNILGMRDGLEITNNGVECEVAGARMRWCGMGEKALGRRPSRGGLDTHLRLQFKILTTERIVKKPSHSNNYYLFNL